MTSKIVEFLSNHAADDKGRYLVSSCFHSDDWIEDTHDFIQWWFPNRIPSQFNPDAPLLTDEDVTAIQNSVTATAGAMMCLARVLAFYGYTYDSVGNLIRGPQFENKKFRLCGEFNHNHMRLTRIFNFLREIELTDIAEEICKLVCEDATCEKSKSFWLGALGL